MKFITEISEREWNDMLNNGWTWGDLMTRFSPPVYCGYDGALEGIMGCWSLTSWPWKCTEIFCHTCDCFDLPTEYKAMPLSDTARNAMADFLLKNRTDIEPLATFMPVTEITKETRAEGVGFEPAYPLDGKETDETVEPK